MSSTFSCRSSCAACCIAPTISSPTSAHPQGKPAGVVCLYLDEMLRCAIFNSPERPKVCASLQPCFEMCQGSREEALAYLIDLERATAP